ncbi:NSE3 protein, partial [Onychorhynchus coronatus]|nr:NSE3 protein [Onychorhynchus coronatus]
ELVQFLLVKDQKKIPIKRADMLKNVVREYRDAYMEIVSQAGRILQETFGLRLVEIDPKIHSYILVSSLPCAEANHPCRAKEKEKMGLLIVILSFIFMKGNAVKDSALWEFLRWLRVHKGEQHEIFGDVQKLVTEEFVRQKYLKITPIPLMDPPEFSYQWGPRAALETSKEDILNFVAKVRPCGGWSLGFGGLHLTPPSRFTPTQVQGKSPKFWTSQHNEATAPQ